MKNIILFFIIFFSTPAFCCDACGCSVGNSSMGILPQFQKNLIGYKYSYVSFKNPASDLYSNLDETVSADEAQTNNLWMRYYPSDKWQLFAFIPYKMHNRYLTSGETIHIEGFGDVSLLANYLLVNTGDSLNKNWKHTLLIGGGLKLPTGKYRQRDKNQSLLPTNFQVGTGAYTLTLNAIYTTRFKKAGMNVDVFYRMSNSNESSYRVGNQGSSALSFFYWKSIGSFSLLPNVGLYGEMFGKDTEYDAVLPYSGGQIFMLNTGLDVYYKRLIFQGLFQTPLSYTIPSGQTTPMCRFSLGWSILF